MNFSTLNFSTLKVSGDDFSNVEFSTLNFSRQQNIFRAPKNRIEPVPILLHLLFPRCPSCPSQSRPPRPRAVGAVLKKSARHKVGISKQFFRVQPCVYRTCPSQSRPPQAPRRRCARARACRGMAAPPTGRSSAAGRRLRTPAAARPGCSTETAPNAGVYRRAFV